MKYCKLTGQASRMPKNIQEYIAHIYKSTILLLNVYLFFIVIEVFG